MAFEHRFSLPFGEGGAALRRTVTDEDSPLTAGLNAARTFVILWLAAGAEGASAPCSTLMLKPFLLFFNVVFNLSHHIFGYHLRREIFIHVGVPTVYQAVEHHIVNSRLNPAFIALFAEPLKISDKIDIALLPCSAAAYYFL